MAIHRNDTTSTGRGDTIGLVFDIKRFAVHDGPGIRTTVFLKGCPLICGWCHNPEGKNPHIELSWRKERCTGCGSCQDACPNNAIHYRDRPELNKTLCDLCGACVDVCPSEALELVGTSMTEVQVLDYIKKDIPFYDQSRGGATFSGGEPLAQPEFLYSLLKACKKQEIHTTVDTCGYAPQEDLLKITEYTDLFLYDIKAVSDKIHLRETGVSNRIILQNLGILAPDKVIARIPFIPGVNDSIKEIEELANLISSHRIDRVTLLPYHRGGVEKAKRLVAVESVVFEPPSSDTIQKALAVLQDYGLKAQVGG